MIKKSIILDRDGVINHDSDYYIKSPDECHFIPGSLQAIARLNKAGYHVFIATNQSGVSRGFYNEKMLAMIHQKLRSALLEVGGQIDEIFYCPHHPDEKCKCRKPEPGLIFKIQKKYDVNLTETFFVGDSVVDMDAAMRAGCKPVLVLTGNGAKTLASYPNAEALNQYADLAAVVDAILDGTLT